MRDICGVQPPLDRSEQTFADPEVSGLRQIVQEAWHQRLQGRSFASALLDQALDQVLRALESGKLRVVQPSPDGQTPWQVHEWVKQAVLLVFATRQAGPWNPQAQGQMVQDDSTVGQAAGLTAIWWDKMGLGQRAVHEFRASGARVVPGAFVRPGVFLGASCVIMPSGVNVGAFIGDKTMVDYGACVGSCAYVGPGCHVAAGVTIGGVLEPVQSCPVIIEEGCFIGAGSHILEGVHVGSGAVLGAGVVLTASTKIVVRQTGDILYGRVPSGAVLIPGTWADPHTPGLGLSCAVMIKQVDAGTRAKTSLNELLRDGPPGTGHSL